MSTNKGHVNEGYVPGPSEGRGLQYQGGGYEWHTAPPGRTVQWPSPAVPSNAPPPYHPYPPSELAQGSGCMEGAPPPYFIHADLPPPPPAAPCSHCQPPPTVPSSPPLYFIPHPVQPPPGHILPNSHGARPAVSQPRVSPSSMNLSFRLNFLRKVYIFYLVQMLILNAFVCVFLYSKEVHLYFLQHYEYTIFGIVVECILVVMLVWSPQLRRTKPINYTLLICTITLSFLVGVAAANSNGVEVLLTSTIIVVTTAGLFLDAGKKKRFGDWGGYAIVVVPTIVACLAYYYAYPSKLIHIIIAGTAALIMSLLIHWDMVLMLRGTHKCYPITDESACLCGMLLQKCVFTICFLVCVLFVFF